MKSILLVSSFVVLGVFGCGQKDFDISTAGSLPLLTQGKKIGTIIGFNPTNPPETSDSINARWNEAISNGMTTGRIQIDWTELEPQPEVYDKNTLEQRLTSRITSISDYRQDTPHTARP